MVFWNQNIQLDCSCSILYLVMDGGDLIFRLLPVSNYTNLVTVCANLKSLLI
jgi:hypothetical protein